MFQFYYKEKFWVYICTGVHIVHINEALVTLLTRMYAAKSNDAHQTARMSSKSGFQQKMRREILIPDYSASKS